MDLTIMRKPLIVATATSFVLHSAVVFALVAVPALSPRSERPPAQTAEVSLAPEFASASKQPPPAPVFLQQAKPAEEAAKDASDPPVLADIPPPDRQIASLTPSSPPAPLAPPLPDVTLAAPIDALKAAEAAPVREAPSASVSAERSPSDSVATSGPPAENVARESAPAEASAETRATTLATPAALDSAGAVPVETPATGEARPGEVAEAGPAVPLFPSDAVAVSSTRSADALSLPVIASDDVGAQAIDPSELPSVSDVGPGGETNALGAGAASRAKTLAPPAPKRPASDQGGKASRSAEGRSGDGRSGEGRSGDGRSGDGRPGEGRSGDGAIYDPAVRSRYSTNLFTYLRRSLVFPTGGATGTTTIRFVLDRSGRILQSGVVGSSGSAQLDDQALAIIQRAAPYPRFPDGFGSSQLEVTLPVTFK